MSFSPPSLEELGQLLEAYRFEAFIAQGGMGAVYHARQRSLDREVAIKILPRELGADPSYYRSFKTEARAMAKLNHPNLVGVYDSGSVDGMLYIAMELVAGESLYHKYYRLCVEPAEVVRLIKGICDGLAHAHENDVIHRDIKPANIILTAKGVPKIGDFGLAQPSGLGDGTGIAMGTPGYTAPEVIANPHSADRRSDLFAVGVILYELLTGQLPASPAQMPSTLTGCDPVFDKIFRRATHPSPTFRYPSAESFSKALDDAVVGRSSRRIFTHMAPSTPGSSASAPTLKRSLSTGSGPVTHRTAPVEAATSKTHAMRLKVSAEVAAAKGVTQGQGGKAREVKVSGGGLARNILIIIALCVGIYFAIGVYDERVAEQAIARKKYDAELAAKMEAKLATENLAAARAAERAQEVRQPERPSLPAAGSGGETPMESLARLKPKLVSGAREDMPIGTFGFGDHRFFFVPTPLPWREARQFAEEHGGHLAILPTTMALEMTAKELPEAATVWIGAGISGRGQWNWLDGSTVPRATGAGSFAAMAKAGHLVLSHKSSEKFPFLIQWKMQGTNGASLEEALERAAESLKTAKPVFPTGTEACENRYFLLVERSLTWKEADALAQKAGGHLAVIVSRTEMAWIETHLAAELPADGVAWFGARRSGDIWSWSTREPWSPVKWSQEPSANATALAINARAQWMAIDPEQKTSAFLIEWSRDSGTSPAAGTKIDGLPAEFKVRKNQAAAAYRHFADTRDKALAENCKSLRSAVDSWHRNLVHSAQEEHQSFHSKLATSLGTSDRIGDISRIKDSPAKVTVMLETYMDAQKKIDLEFTKKIMALREKYLEVLTTGADSAENSGQSSAAAAIRAEMATSGGDFASFISYLGEPN